MFSSTCAQVECSRTKSLPVCGMNGETFESHCHAENLRVAVDYSGPCTAIPVSGRAPVSECLLLNHDNCTNSKSHAYQYIPQYRQSTMSPINGICHWSEFRLLHMVFEFFSILHNCLPFSSLWWHILSWSEVSSSSPSWVYWSYL